MNILIVAPHPDDEVLGCGGIIKKYSLGGNNVYVLVVTRGTPRLYKDSSITNVRNEALKAHQILGVKETVFLEFHAPELDLASLSEIAQAIHKEILRLDIQKLYLPHRGDIHNDHTVVFKSGLVAARPVHNNPVKAIYCYETLSETEWAAPFGSDVFIPTNFVDISDHMEFKLQAMECFQSQIRDFPSTRSVETIESLAKFRGATVGFHRAEAFLTIRTIED